MEGSARVLQWKGWEERAETQKYLRKTESGGVEPTEREGVPDAWGTAKRL